MVHALHAMVHALHSVRVEVRRGYGELGLGFEKDKTADRKMGDGFNEQPTAASRAANSFGQKKSHADIYTHK